MTSLLALIGFLWLVVQIGRCVDRYLWLRSIRRSTYVAGNRRLDSRDTEYSIPVGLRLLSARATDQDRPLPFWAKDSTSGGEGETGERE